MAREGESMKWHIEVLSASQLKVLARLGPVMSENGFYLGGGTAVALRLGHRKSVDLDWFREGKIQDSMRLSSELMGEVPEFKILSVSKGTLNASISGVKCSFMEYRYPLLASVEKMAKCNCDIASLDDLACMKLSAVAQRGSKKDFVDVYALCAKHRPLLKLFELYQRKYETEDVAHVLFSLSYFGDAENGRMPVMLWDTDWKNIKESLRGWLSDI
jgi:hypothetical protein